jgi:bifunctional non-homologous end joining protein LigD
MGLAEYKKKRSFDETPEPTGGKSSGSKLQFVVQKHDASRLHYDFRLELKGVLKSWAIPKGPSLNPADKRLAMLVEDHPFDYKDFEGIIPEGNYGAGTVIIWDEGTYEPVEDLKDKKEQEKHLTHAFHKGSMKIRLYGKKLKGEFALVQTKSRGENSWLLIKHRDEFSSGSDIREEDTSVRSGVTIDELAADKNAKQWKSNRTEENENGVKKEIAGKSKAPKTKSGSKSVRSTNSKSKNTATADLLAGIQGKKRQKFPEDIEPMLATLVDEPVEGEDWLYEVKWDGYRAMSYQRKGSVTLRSRNNKDFNKKFYPVHDALRDLNLNAVLDGEIVVINSKGEPDFNALQQWRSEADGQLVYYVFDLLWLEGYSLQSVPLKERRKLLSYLIPQEGLIRLSENFEVSGNEFFRQAEKLGLEGIMAKKASGHYIPGVRSKEWLKIKTEQHQEAVIGGYTRNENSNKQFSALLLGVFDNGEFVSIGPVGTGFTAKTQSEILEKLRPLVTKECPFNVVPDYNKPSRFRPNPPKAEVTWVKPEIVVEVAYRAKSNDGAMRHPSFRGLREDKRAERVGLEKSLPVTEVLETPVKRSKKILPQPSKQERKTLLNPSDETQVRMLEGHELKFTNLSKIFWPEEGFSKRDMLNYYYQIAPYMLPYMKDRPQTLNRFPNGIFGKSFYQKDVTGKVPSWLETYKYFSEGDQREKHFLVATDEASLLYIASLGCIEMNPWSSRTASPDNPDWCVIDLDPDKNNSFDQVIEAARVTKEVLDSIGVTSFCKTSGSTGLHIYIPLEAKYSYEDSKEFARAIVKVVHTQLPSFTSIERKVSDRKGKMYLDFLQNRPQATVAGPYSLRPKPGAPVSMPLHWDEVKRGLSIRDFNITNAVARVKREGDLFDGVLGKGADINQALLSLMKTFGKIKE